MRLFAFIVSLTIALSNIGCRSYGDYNDNIPTATPIPPRYSTPVTRTWPLPANFPTRPLALPPSPPNKPNCAAACVMDAFTGRVLYSHNGRQRRQVASTQKLLTALVVLDHGDLDDKVTIQHSDTLAAPTKLGFRKGESYTRRDLLNALLIRSYNDVALALARDTAGSVPAFARKMNAKARQIGMYNSSFANPNGLPALQYSTAIDMARCAYFAYRNPELRKIVCKTQETFFKNDGKSVTMNNTNKLLTRHPWITGMKTGYTNAAGRCLVSSAGYNGRHVIVVVLGCQKSRIWEVSDGLINWAFSGSN